MLDQLSLVEASLGIKVVHCQGTFFVLPLHMPGCIFHRKLCSLPNVSLRLQYPQRTFTIAILIIFVNFLILLLHLHQEVLDREIRIPKVEQQLPEKPHHQS